MILTDSIVTLRPLEIKDKRRLAEIANNKNISVNLRDGFPNPYTEIHAEEFIKKFGNTESPYVFAIEWNGNYVGNISLIKGSDVYRKSAEIGYFLGEDYWNKGIMTRAVKLLCDFGFKETDIVKIYAGVFEYNTASLKVLEKCGFSKEAVLKKAIFKQNKLWDEIRYSLFKTDEL